MFSKKGALWFNLFLLVFISFNFFVCGKVIPKSINWVTTYEDALKMANSQNKNMILDFYAEW
jgi:hypothetical protein